MIGRLWFYRRRRVLPFLAASCLVFINGATLVPLVVPGARAVANDGNPGVDDGSWRRAAYERGDGAEPEPVIAAALPPVVKNLRRPTAGRQDRTVSRCCGERPPDVRCQRTAFGPWPRAAGMAVLDRLCRLLL